MGLGCLFIQQFPLNSDMLLLKLIFIYLMILKWMNAILWVFVKSNILNFNVFLHYLYFNIFILQIFITNNWIVIESWLEIAVIRHRLRQLPRKESHHINGQLGLIQIELLWNTWIFYDDNLLALQFEKIFWYGVLVSSVRKTKSITDVF